MHHANEASQLSPAADSASPSLPNMVTSGSKKTRWRPKSDLKASKSNGWCHIWYIHYLLYAVYSPSLFFVSLNELISTSVQSQRALILKNVFKFGNINVGDWYWFNIVLAVGEIELKAYDLNTQSHFNTFCLILSVAAYLILEQTSLLLQ